MYDHLVFYRLDDNGYPVKVKNPKTRKAALKHCNKQYISWFDPIVDEDAKAKYESGQLDIDIKVLEFVYTKFTGAIERSKIEDQPETNENEPPIFETICYEVNETTGQGTITKMYMSSCLEDARSLHEGLVKELKEEKLGEQL